MHVLSIKNGKVHLDGKEMEFVTEYCVKSSAADDKLTELNLKLIVSTVEIEPLLTQK